MIVNRDTLVRAFEVDTPVKLYRHRDWDLLPLNGFVVGLTEELVALQSLADGVYLEGYDIMLLSDVTEVEENIHLSQVHSSVAGVF